MAVVRQETFRPYLFVIMTTVNISTRTIFTTLIIFGLSFFAWMIKDVLIFLVFAIILSAALHPAVKWLENHGIPRKIGVLSLFVLIVTLVAVIIITFAPLVITESQQIVVALVHFVLRLVSQGNAQNVITQNIADWFQQIATFFTASTIQTFKFVTTGGLLTVVFGLLFYHLTVEHGAFRHAVAHLVPVKFRAGVITTGDAIERRLSLWLRGQLTLGLVIAVLTGVGLAVLRVKYVLVLALIAGLGELVPMVGPYLGLIPGAAVGFMISPLTGGLVVLLYYLVQQIENNFLAPRIVSKAVGLRPVVVFLALLVGVRLSGVVGLLLAIPMVIICQEGYRFYQHLNPVPDNKTVYV